MEDVPCGVVDSSMPENRAGEVRSGSSRNTPGAEKYRILAVRAGVWYDRIEKTEPAVQTPE